MDKFKKLLGLGVMGVTGLGAVKAEGVKHMVPSIDTVGGARTEIVTGKDKDSKSERVDTKSLKEVQKKDYELKVAAMDSICKMLKENWEAARSIKVTKEMSFIDNIDALKGANPDVSNIEISKKMPKEIYAFAENLLEENKGKMEDEKYRNVVPDALENSVMGSGLPSVIAFGKVMNQQVDDMTSKHNTNATNFYPSVEHKLNQNSDDITSRNELNEWIRILTDAEYDAFSAKYEFDKSVMDLKKFKKEFEKIYGDLLASK
jgi:hypothetical protein